ncbi:Serine acetyltransferase [Geodermatophilus saharensis]|uniref:Serine acetyltransferase n=1 Tax=Geodermatophilus saharensis TaxID=1137994 RepID=A0A238ZWU5_9ACTN|nr:WxcM-like domain-containing protein [Geodermatophilus saharensis]SNR87729.1 Serine acetyltransferase [Geodermatophilus saharensis]
MSFTVHPAGLCESAHVGAGTRVAAFAHVHAGAVVGDRVTLGSGVRVGDGVRLADDVSVGANAVLAGEEPGAAETVVGPGASVGAGSTVVPGVRIGRRARVAPGTVVTRDVPPNAVVEGNPARIVGYVDAGPDVADAGEVRIGALPASRVPGVNVLRITRADDLRGSLVAADFDQDLPFVPRRFFTVFGVPSSDVRGAHAHRRCHQLLVCVQGSINAVVDNGVQRQEFVLDRPDVGLHMEPMTWGTQYRYSADAVLLVLASDPYDPDDYIRDHDEFLAEVGQPAPA